MTDIQTETQLQSAIKDEQFSVICFHSTRSTYSRRTVQTLAELEAEFRAARLWLVDADRDEFVPLLSALRVVAIPTILIFHAGARVEILVGDRSKEVFAGFLQKLVQPLGM